MRQAFPPVQEALRDDWKFSTGGASLLLQARYPAGARVIRRVSEASFICAKAPASAKIPPVQRGVLMPRITAKMTNVRSRIELQSTLRSPCPQIRYCMLSSSFSGAAACTFCVGGNSFARESWGSSLYREEILYSRDCPSA